MWLVLDVFHDGKCIFITYSQSLFVEKSLKISSRFSLKYPSRPLHSFLFLLVYQGSLEGAYFLTQGTSISLSEQMLCSCDTSDNQGCSGGFMNNAFTWVSKNGLCTEAAYPYVSASGTSPACSIRCAVVPGLTGLTYTDVANSETSLAAAVVGQPISVAVDADESWKQYSGGILTQTSATNLNHAVLTVGYGTSSYGGKFWKVKNSWGTTWGEGKQSDERGGLLCCLSLCERRPTTMIS